MSTLCSPSHANCAQPDSLGLLTLAEAARDLRCSRTHLHRILSGSVADLPPLPAFHIGRRAFIRRRMLQEWIASLEARELEARYAGGSFGLRDDEWESIAGA
jgi:hypothetical protein